MIRKVSQAYWLLPFPEGVGLGPLLDLNKTSYLVMIQSIEQSYKPAA